MTITTDLSQAPYFDDYVETKDYYGMLFQPGVSVQAREMNQLRTILQKQIERFGDNIFKQGTIVSGCNFSFFPTHQYVKLLDNEIDGTVTAPVKYKGNFAICESSGLSAQILDYADGFESADPNLKTIYLRYQNSGDDGETEEFTAGDTLLIKDLYSTVYKVSVSDGGTGFSNSDTLVVLPRLIVNVASGSYANGDYVINNLGANVQIINIDSTTYANASQVILTVKPRSGDLTTVTISANAWTVSVGDNITNQSNAVSARCEGVIGSGLRGKAITDTIGRVTSIAVLSRGQGYTLPPYVTLKSANNTTGVGLLSLSAQNYIGKVRISTVAGAVGNGYAFGVSQGVIYQKGFFLRVEEQNIVVSKYDTAPNAVSVGFHTEEDIVNYNVDPSLRDPVNNTDNTGAPGADRLKLTPKLTLLTKAEADANSNFFTIVEWSEGNPVKQNQYTAYNKIEDEIATRASEQTGDFVVDSFLMSTRSPLNPALEGNTYSVVVDPGTAYISGYRVQTQSNYTIDVSKALDTKISNNHSVNLNYGAYIYANNLAGVFQFNTGDTIDLYDTSKGFLSNNDLIVAQNTSPVGTKIGTARIRSLLIDESTPGNGDAIYRMYIFGINMNQGKNFRDVKSIYYNGTWNKGIADIVLDVDGTTNANVAILYEANTSQLLFSTGVESLKNANNISYIYRTIDQSLTVANTGLVVKSISSTPDEFYPYTGALTSAQMQDLYVVPTAIDLIATSNIAGTVSVNTTTPNVVGTGTTFLTDLRAGDFVEIAANSTVYQIARVQSVVNNTLFIMGSNNSFANGTSGVYRTFPKNVPVPFGYRSGLSANVDTNQNILTLNFGTAFGSVTSANVTVGVNIQRTNVSELTKTPNRSRFVKLCTSNNAGSTIGPWCLGVPDIFRLRGVYIGNSSVSNTGTNSITSFFVDHNQNPDYLDLGYLYIAPKNNVSLGANDYILVEFDHFTSSGAGFYDTVSYVSSNTAQRVLVDSQPLSNLTSTINSFEIPEVFDNKGYDYDLIQYFDFRPIVSNTVSVGTTPGGAPLNPSNTVSFGNTRSQSNENKFPLPGTQFLCNIEEYIGRTDSVIVSSDGTINVLNGKPDSDVNKRYAPTVPPSSLKLTDLVVPSYPNLPIVRGVNINQILNTFVMNGRFLKLRSDTKAITKPRSAAGSVFDVPRVYTMADIGHLERRLQDVEYYVSLNMLEANVMSQAIASSIDPSLNRFKFGFFADDLSTYAFSDRENPSYSAYIEDNAAVPEKMTWDVYFNNAIGGADFIDFMVVNQENATWSDSLGPVCILQYVTYNIQVINGQYYLTTGQSGVPPTPIANPNLPDNSI